MFQDKSSQIVLFLSSQVLIKGKHWLVILESKNPLMLVKLGPVIWRLGKEIHSLNTPIELSAVNTTMGKAVLGSASPVMIALDTTYVNLMAALHVWKDGKEHTAQNVRLGTTGEKLYIETYI